ncbi:MAG: hypothetical protein HQ546_04765, partial [Planctomycetes bacterium]|nr:hypothetical protein [Planctomycetota bacterium]
MNVNRRMWRLACAVSVGTMALALLAGCQQYHPDLPRMFLSAPFDPATDGAYDVAASSKYATYEKELTAFCSDLPAMNHQNYAMLAANRAMIEQSLGHTRQASQAALDSQAVMNGQIKGEKGRATAAALADESAKVFKGECYENAMLNCCVGLYSLQLGDAE